VGTDDRRFAPASPPPARSTRRALAALCLTALAAGAAGAQVVINEVDYDQASTDTAEFVELKNVGLVAEDLSGYTLELVNGNGGGAVVYDTIALPAVNLAPGDYFVICANAATVPDCDLDDGPDTNFIQNGAPDAIGLRQSGALVDALSYEGDSATPYTEGTGVVIGDDAVGDTGLSRCPDGADSDQNNLDFILTAITPGAASTCPGPTVVINEIDYDQPGTDTAEFVELKNVGPAPVDLSGMTLQLINGAGMTIYDTILLPAVSLAPGAYFVICANAATVANCDLDDDPDTNFIQNGAPDAVALLLGGSVLDAVSYEGDTAAPYTEGSGVGLEDPSSTGDDDLGISRFPDGVDTDMNNVDLGTRCITPGAPNTAADSDCGVVAETALVINEIDYDQPSTDTMEFVEIKNVGAVAVDLGTITLELVNGNGGGATVYDSIALPAVSLAAGDYFVVCADAATVVNCDLDDDPDTNFIQNGSPDAVALWQGATLLDTVSYEGDSGAPYTEGSGAGLEDPAGDNLGISRFPDGVDTGANNVDLSGRCITPGAANSAASADCAAPGPPALVINEIDYDQPGTDGAEFVEIKNVGTGGAELGGVELLLVNGNGGGATIYQTIALPAVTLAGGDYFVVCGDSATVPNCDLDTTPDSNLVQNGAPDAVALVLAGVLLDAVSYEGDTGAPYTEGSGTGLEDPGAAGSDNLGIARLPDGADSDVNNVDFSTRCVTPGAANTILDTGCNGSGGAAEIFQIQGAGEASPFAGQSLSALDNVVTAVGVDGFFVQTPAERDDGDVDTSNGIFVFTGGAPAVAVGDRVDVSGTVVEYFDFTEFTSGATVTVLSSGNPLPPAVAFDATTPSPDPASPSCALEFECYEGMRITIAAGVVGGSNQRFGTDPIAEVFVSAGSARALREPGVEYPGLAVPTIPVWDGNPEVFELDPDKLGLPNQIIPAGSTFTAEGALGFEFGGYELWPMSLSVTPAPLPVPVRERAADEFTVGSLNMFRFFDDVDDPPTANANGELIRDDTVVSSAEYLRRRNKFVVHILDVLRAPDIVAVQEVEKLEVLQDLAADIAAVEPTVQYTAYLVEGNDIGTIDVGFLVRDTVAVDAVTQYGYSDVFTYDGSLLNDRPPLLLEGRYVAGGADAPITVLAVHNRSLSGIDDPADGDRVRHKRLDQAQFVAQLVEDLQTADPAEPLVVVGDFNAYEFTDGYVDVVGQIKGDFDPAQSLLSGPDLVSPDLVDQVLSLPPAERHSFVFSGSGQVLDHALTSAGLASRVRGFAYARGNADAANDLIFDDTTPANLALRSSDHDGFVLYVSADSDGDGVVDGQDVCPGTVIPEGVPTHHLGVLRWALVDDDTTFDTIVPGHGFAFRFTTQHTGGCSCEQIIDALHLGNGHTKFGCSSGAMLLWTLIVSH
jgi:predicted extracellular nuclease